MPKLVDPDLKKSSEDKTARARALFIERCLRYLLHSKIKSSVLLQKVLGTNIFYSQHCIIENVARTLRCQLIINSNAASN